MYRAQFETEAVHSGRSDFRRLGVHAPPLDLSTTYPLEDLDEAIASIDELVAGGTPLGGQAVYSRLHNPTVARFEEALAKLESGEDSLAFASGMAALTACLLAARGVFETRTGRRGRHVVAVRPLYGGSDHLLTSGLLDLDVTWARPGDVGRAVRDDTILVLVETPANPTLQLVDVVDVVRQAGEVPVLVDSTFATPVLQRPLTLGAALSLHSATKFLGGHGDVLAGVVAARDEVWIRALRQVRLITGAVLHPLAAYLLHRGLSTLPVRVRAAQQTAAELARRLAENDNVSRVWYPGLPACDPLALVGEGLQMSGPGSILAFEVTGGAPRAARFLRHLRWITPAVSLGSTDTLIQHPAGLTHRVVDEEGQAEGGITPAMLRLSVGLEEVNDLWLDLAQALDLTRDRRLVAHSAVCV
ncbi:MAG: PLP-dependent transferase [Thermoanaerobaculia bacterium]|nr:PLP-dependent transferase [Thermoanaerobaculia bacterium]